MPVHWDLPGTNDPQVHLAMLKKYDKVRHILMPLHAADPGYQSFGKKCAADRCLRAAWDPGMKSTANAKRCRRLP